MADHPKIIVAKDARAAAETAAAKFVASVQAGLAKRPQAAVALSGGSTPRRLHRLLADTPYNTAFDWKRVHIFWADDRLVPHSDAASNYGAVHTDLIAPLKLDHRQIHPIPVSENPAESALSYEETLRRHFGLPENQTPVFDLICLGLGTDGHTASLFPGNAALAEQRRWVAAVEGGVPNVSRVTLTLPVINSARRIMFLVTGKAKADIVHQAIERPEMKLPVHRIYPTHGSITWILDAPAAQSFSGKAAKPE